MMFGLTSLYLFLDFPSVFLMIIVLILWEQKSSSFSNLTALPKTPINHLSSIDLVKKNVQLVISQVRKWVLYRGLGVKTVWGRSIPKILPSVNGQLVCLHGFTLVENMLGFLLEWKVTYRNAQRIASDIIHETTREAIPGETDEIGEGPEGLRIERIIDRRGEQQTLAV